MQQQFAGPFLDRSHAGRILATYVSAYRDYSDLVILGLTRGGMPVAAEVANALGAPLDIFLVRKLTVPERPEKPLGAVASGGVRLLNRETMRDLGIGIAAVNIIIEKQLADLRRRERQYRDGRPPLDIEGKTVILVDDGVATGSSMRAGIAALKERRPERVIIALPVAEGSCCDALRDEVDEVICAHTPEPFFSVARWYRDFSPVMDRQIHDMLQQHVMAQEWALQE